jgi:hypothetical protein
MYSTVFTKEQKNNAQEIEILVARVNTQHRVPLRSA